MRSIRDHFDSAFATKMSKFTSRTDRRNSTDPCQHLHEIRRAGSSSQTGFYRNTWYARRVTFETKNSLWNWKKKEIDSFFKRRRTFSEQLFFSQKKKFQAQFWQIFSEENSLFFTEVQIQYVFRNWFKRFLERKLLVSEPETDMDRRRDHDE